MTDVIATHVGLDGPAEAPVTNAPTEAATEAPAVTAPEAGDVEATTEATADVAAETTNEATVNEAATTDAAPAVAGADDDATGAEATTAEAPADAPSNEDATADAVPEDTTETVVEGALETTADAPADIEGDVEAVAPAAEEPAAEEPAAEEPAAEEPAAEEPAAEEPATEEPAAEEPAAEEPVAEAPVPEIEAPPPVFTEEENAAMAQDEARVEAAASAAERETCERIAATRRRLFERRATQRDAHARLLQAQTLAAMPGASNDELSARAAADEAAAEALVVQHGVVTEDRAQLIQPFAAAVEVLARVHRVEETLRRTAAFLAEERAALSSSNGDASIATEILAHIKSLQEKRDAELRSIEQLRDRVRKTAAELRRGHQVERRDKTVSIGGHNAHTDMTKNYERSTSPRENVLDAVEDDVAVMRAYNEVVDNERLGLAGDLNALIKERTKLHTQVNVERRATQKLQAQLADEGKRKGLLVRKEEQTISDLHRANAALTTTIETLMQQLNTEYYGASGGPASQALAHSRQARIADRPHTADATSPQGRALRRTSAH